MNLFKHFEKTKQNKLLGLAKNYNSNLKNPLYFIKPWETLVCMENKNSLELNLNHKLRYESELAIVLNQDITNFDKNNHTDYYEGYFHALDISRDNEDTDPNRPFNFFDKKNSLNSTPYGNFISKNIIKNPNLVRIKTKINNIQIFDTNYENLAFSVDNFMEHLSKETQLIKGDIILCGAEKLSDEIIKKNDEVVSELYYENNKISELKFKIM